MKIYLHIPFLLISFFCFGQNSDYVFGWTHLNKSHLRSPRGGTTKGIEITLDTTEHKNWNLLKNENLGKFEKDKLAILSMEGHQVHHKLIRTIYTSLKQPIPLCKDAPRNNNSKY